MSMAVMTMPCATAVLLPQRGGFGQIHSFSNKFSEALRAHNNGIGYRQFFGRYAHAFGAVRTS
jgi:hypothetical protein